MNKEHDLKLQNILKNENKNQFSFNNNDDQFIKNVIISKEDEFNVEKKRSMSPLLKDRRKLQKVKPKDLKDNQINNELKTTLQIGQNVNDLIILNSKFQIKEKDEVSN